MHNVHIFYASLSKANIPALAILGHHGTTAALLPFILPEIDEIIIISKIYIFQAVAKSSLSTVSSNPSIPQQPHLSPPNNLNGP
jgi:hypothetical protein